MAPLHRSRPPARFGLLAALAASALANVGTGAERSPFEPAGNAPAAVAAPASPADRFEFRGVMTIGPDTFVTLVDTSNSRSLTIKLGETVEGVSVSDFRPDDGSVQIESGGQPKRMTLREAKIVALAVPPPTPPPSPGGPPNPGQVGGPAVAGAPMSDDEARARMQRVAEEIRRRREMRRQMLEGQQGRPAGRPAN
jgi:hypothetical protein